MSDKPGQASLDRIVETYRGEFESMLVFGIPLIELTGDELRASVVMAHKAFLQQADHRADFNMFDEGGRR